MNMKKILLAGIAIGALASTGANAANIVAARVSGINLAVGTTRISIADSAVYAAGARFTALGNLAAGAGAFYTGYVPGTSVTDISKSANIYQLGLGTLGSTAAFAPVNPGQNVAKTFRVTFALDGTGDPRFAGPITAANFAPTYATTGVAGVAPVAGVSTGLPLSTAECSVTAWTIVAGGVAGGNSVTANFTVTDTKAGSSVTSPGCNNNNAPIGVVLVDAPIQLNALGTANITGTFNDLGTGAIIDNTPGTAALVQTVPTYDIAISDRGLSGTGVVGGGGVVTTAFAFSGTNGAYTSFATTVVGGPTYDAVIGSARAAYTAQPTVAAGSSLGLSPGLSTPATGAANANTAIFAGLNGAALPAATVTFLATNTSGTFDTFSPEFQTAAGALVAGTKTAVPATDTTKTTAQFAGVAAPIASSNIAATIMAPASTVSVTTPQTLNATIRVVQAAGSIVNSSAVSSSGLEVIGQQGTRFTAPWFGGSEAGSKAIVRISSSAGTGAITATIANVSGRPAGVTGTATCPAGNLTAIPAGGELVFDEPKATACFGRFQRGDITFSISGSQTGLSAKMRIFDQNGSVSETSLGNISQGVATSQ